MERMNTSVRFLIEFATATSAILAVWYTFGVIIPCLVILRFGHHKNSIVKILKPDYAVGGRFCYGKIVSDPSIFNCYHLRIRVIRDEDIAPSAYYTKPISGSIHHRLWCWFWELKTATDKELENKN